MRDRIAEESEAASSTADMNNSTTDNQPPSEDSGNER